MVPYWCCQDTIQGRYPGAGQASVTSFWVYWVDLQSNCTFRGTNRCFQCHFEFGDKWEKIYSLKKKARTYKNCQLCSWIIPELKMLERRGLYLSHPCMSLHPNFEVLGWLPDFLITKMTSRQLRSEANSTSLPMGFLCTEKNTSYNWSIRPQILAQSKQVLHHWIDMIKGFLLVSNLVLWAFSKRG